MKMSWATKVFPLHSTYSVHATAQIAIIMLIFNSRWVCMPLVALALCVITQFEQTLSKLHANFKQTYIANI